MLILKLLLVPAFLAVISLAGRRWGASVAGWLAGFPVVAGPILFFLSLERGVGFAASASAASLSAVLASVAFNVAYSHACLRFRFLLSLVLALAAWFVVALFLAQLPESLGISFVVAGLTLFLAPRACPKTDVQVAATAEPAYELLARAVAGTLLTLFVTGVAAAVGPAWSGLLAVFPVLGSVLAVFSQRIHGSAFVVQLLRGMVTGLRSFAAFCFVLALSLPHLGLTLSFVASVVAALLVQWATRGYLASRSTGRETQSLGVQE